MEQMELLKHPAQLGARVQPQEQMARFKTEQSHGTNNTTDVKLRRVTMGTHHTGPIV